jgi:hypothetical protein
LCCQSEKENNDGGKERNERKKNIRKGKSENTELENEDKSQVKA